MFNYDFKKKKIIAKNPNAIIEDFNERVETDPLKRLPFKVFKNEIEDDEDYDLVVYSFWNIFNLIIVN